MLPSQFIRSLVAIFFLFLLAAGSLPAATYYVAPAGLNSNPGTFARPWKTIQKAANTLKPGDTLLVRTGTYQEAVTVNVSGNSTASGTITFANYPGETPVVDGSTLTVPDDIYSALFYIQDHSYITIQGFDLRNYATNDIAATPAAVFITGASSFIKIKRCGIHGIRNMGCNIDNSGNAFAIAVYGSSATPCTGIAINGNNVYDCKTGSSETVTLNGNVANFEVTNNLVHDNNNIGIDFIGYEGTCPVPAQDRARTGICQGNTVWNISSQGNQAYSNGDYSADGLYVDGGTGIVIQQNTSYDNDIGVELASEHSGKFTSDITLQDNTVYSCRQGALLVGGYAATGTGGTEGCTINGNTFWHDDTLQWGIGEMQLRWRTSKCAISNNTMVAGPGNYLVTVPVSAANNVANSLDYNDYYSAAGSAAAQWIWNNRTCTGFAAWKSVSLQDAHSRFANPNINP